MWICNKNCDFSEYLDYKNCKCRKKLVDKLIDECTETSEEETLANITIFENRHTSYIVYIVLMIVIYTTFTGITVYLVYYNWYLI